MNSSDLATSVQSGVQPTFGSETERCLWLAGAGKWEAAHDIVESLPKPAASWIHALLHREEGDLGNAGYWYHRADRPMPAQTTSIKAEWKEIAQSLLG